jgi:hypothetical protein
MARSVASLTAPISVTRLALGFVAGFLATLTFHQIGIWVLHAVGYVPFAAWGTAPKPPFGVPSVISLSFWGGVWGIIFVLIERWLARFPGGYWVGATVFGAIVPTLVLMFVVFPLRGQPVGAGFAMNLVLTFLLVHALWGLGTALILGVLTGWRNQPS